MPELKVLPENELDEFLAALKALQVPVGPASATFVNAEVDQTVLWEPRENVEPAQMAAGLRAPRPFNSFKSVFLPVREVIARYGKGEQGDPLQQATQRTVALVGLRGCECRALGYLDSVMLDEPYPDPFYRARRENTIIVSVDCARAADTCFCNLLGEKAYAEKLFDVNLSPIEGGYLVEAGSEKGGELLEKSRNLLADAGEAHLGQRSAMRRQAAEQLSAQNAQYAFPENIQESIAATVDEVFWRRELSGCVQCGGCGAVCPTCYCFVLYDRKVREDAFERTRVWDCCQFTGYAPMAGPPGGAKPDPRPTHMTKFQHRFAHKFWYDPLKWGVLGCVGCGRCAGSCPGSVDLRRVLSALRREEVVEPA